ALTRPPELEGEATNRAIQLARIAGSPLYVVHVTCREAVEPIRRAREQGWDVWGETCTQYLFRSIDDLAQPGFEGAKYVYSPPAQLFGLYPRKGTVAVGADADLVVFDPERRETISSASHHSKCDYSLYEGTEVVGAPELVFLRGSLLVEDGELVGTPGAGRFV